MSLGHNIKTYAYGPRIPTIQMRYRDPLAVHSKLYGRSDIVVTSFD